MKSSAIPGLVALYAVISYIINLVQLFSCDFASPYKSEFLHFLGLIPPFNMFTIYF
jgi:hypothetical protein